MSHSTFNPDTIPTAYYVADYIQSKGERLELPITSNSNWKIQLKFQMESYGGGLLFRI